MHLVRLHEQLSDLGVDVRAMSLGGVPDGIPNVRTFPSALLLNRNPVHYHTDEGNYKWMLLLSRWWRMMRTPYSVTVHSFRDRREFASASVRRQLRSAYEGARAVIAISDSVKNDLHERIGLASNKISVISSALPLSQWEKNIAVADAVPAQWVNASVRVLANAGRIVRYEGKDLYGLDVLANAMKSLSDADVHCLIVVGQVVDATVLDEIQRIVGENNRIHIARDFKGTLAPIVAHSHIVVRPTRTEGGESLTLAESIELGRWAIGSDSVSRPEYTVLFRNEDDTDLQRVLMQCIARVRNNEFPTPYIPMDDRVQRIKKLVLGV